MDIAMRTNREKHESKGFSEMFEPACKRIRGILLISLVVPFVIACNGSQQTQEAAKKDWVQDEILQQLSELRGEVKALRDEVSGLQGQIASVGNGPRGQGLQQVKLDSEYVLGDPNASMAIVEFTDFQCPYCAQHSRNVMPSIKEKLVATGKAKYLTYDFPLSFHPQAKYAAVAARCAGQQGKYWEMHDVLFQNQRRLSKAVYLDAARDLALDEASFGDCIKNPAVAAAVDSDLAYGNSINVTGTPRFFLGKVKGDVITDVIAISGAQGYAAFASAIARLEKI